MWLQKQSNCLLDGIVSGMTTTPRDGGDGLLYERVARSLVSLIETEGLEPGRRLPSERELAERLGVSRVSVRQGLTVLRINGLVEIRRGDGTYVRRPRSGVARSPAQDRIGSLAHLPAVMEVREAIECQSSWLAAERRTDEDLTAIRAGVEAMERDIAAGGTGAAADERFHRAIADAAHNVILSDIMDQLAEPIALTRRASLSRPGRPQHSLEAHRRILEAIERSDPTGAARAMHEHLAVVGDVAHILRGASGGREQGPGAESDDDTRGTYPPRS
jgi:GntR family transcriptional regulator, transcriptional repressor for pyruvate dehydrogenase complex